MFTDVRQRNWTAEEYFAYPAVSNSDLTLMQGDPLQLMLRIDGKRREPYTDSMRMGNAFDDLILSPDKFDQWTVYENVEEPTTDLQRKFVKAIVNGFEPDEARDVAGYKRGPTGHELYETFAPYMRMVRDKKRLSQDESELLEKMAEHLWEHEAAREAVKYTEHQVCFTGIHKETGLEVKGMVDMLGDHQEYDLKTTSNRWDQIMKPWWISDRGYGTQRAMYCFLAGAYHKWDMTKVKSGLVITRTQQRHRTRCFDLSARLPAYADRLDLLLREYSWRVETGNWAHAVAYYENDGWEAL